MHVQKKILILSALTLFTLPLAGCFARCLDIVGLDDDVAYSCGSSSVTIDVLANDTLPARYTVDGVSVPDPPDATTVGQVSISGNSVVFTPAASASGAVTFNYQVSFHLTDDEASEVSKRQAKVTIYISASDQPPVAGDDSASTPFNVPVLIDVLANDSDPDTAGAGEKFLTASNLTTPINGGSVKLIGAQVQYTPAADYSGSDTFQYTVTDGCGASAVGSVSVTVLPPPPPPPATVLLSNLSDFEITVHIADVLIDTVQPRGTTPLPLDVAAGANQEVRVEALVGMGNLRVTSNVAKFNSEVGYTITYTDDNINPPSIGVEITP